MSNDTFYAYPGWDCVDEPEVADRWMYQHGDKWMAVAPGESEAEWFADSDADRTWTPRERVLPITQIPPSGELAYVVRMGDGSYEPRERILVDEGHPPSDPTPPPLRLVTTFEYVVTGAGAERAQEAAAALVYQMLGSAALVREELALSVESTDVHVAIFDDETGDEVTSW